MTIQSPAAASASLSANTLPETQPVDVTPPASAGFLSRAWSALCVIASLLPSLARRLFGPIEFTEGTFCDTCIDVHEDGEQCPRACIADCVECGHAVDLDHLFRCSVRASHRIANVRSKPFPRRQEVGASPTSPTPARSTAGPHSVDRKLVLDKT